MQQLRIGTLRWAMGGFCLFIGAAMLIVPHQFRNPAYAALQPQLTWWGTIFLLAGAALLAVAVLVPLRKLVILAHVFAGLMLLLLAYGFAITRGWTGTSMYTVLGLGTLLAPLLQRVVPRRALARGYDLFAIVMGLAAVLTGLFMLLPLQFDLPGYGPARPYLYWYGLGFVAAGIGLFLVHVIPVRRSYFILPHLILAAVFYLWQVLLLGSWLWTAVGLYLGLGLLSALLPWLDPWVRRVDPFSLRTRFGLALALTAALPLLVGTLLVSNLEEQMVSEQALLLQERLAGVLAQDVADYVGLHQAAVTSLAGYPGLLRLSAEEQAALLRSANQSYQDAYVFATYDEAGAPIARSDGRPLMAISNRNIFKMVRDADAPVIEVALSRVTGHPTFVFGAPIRDGAGRFAGLALASIEASRLTDVLNRASISAGDAVYLVDNTGRVIAHPDAALVRSFTDFSQVEPVASLLTSQRLQGSLTYGLPGDNRVAGYARVPELGWGVVVERPASQALAGIYRGLDLTFGMLLLLTAAALLVGGLAARSLTAPLAALGRAVEQFAAADDRAPLPSSRVSEVRRLATAFGNMRDRLARRTSERDRAEEELRRNEEQLRLITDALPVLISYIGRDRRYLFNNRSYEEWFGRPRSEITGRHVHEVLGSSYEVTKAYLDAALAGREIHTEAALTLKGDAPRYLQMTYIPHRNSRSEVEGCVVLVTDITSQKLVERQLREETEALEALNRISQLLSAELDLQKLVQAVADAGVELTGAEFGAFFYNVVDEAGERYTLYNLSGVPIEAFEGFPMPRNTHLFGPTFRGETVIRIDDVKQDPRYGRNPPHLGMPAGHLPVTSYLAAPVVSRSGEVLGGLFFGHPQPGVFSERAERIIVNLAAQVAIAMDNAHLFQEAQQAIQARDQFLSVAAHELKTPTTSLLGYAQLLERRAERGGAGDRELRTLRVLSNQARRLHRLMLSLLDLSRLQTGQFVIEPRPVKLVATAQRVIEELQPTVERHTFHISALDEQLLVYGDELRLEQVLYNLVQNAVKYSPEGGEVRVEVTRDKGEVLVAVSDQGIGIPAESLPRLFSRFYRASNVNAQQISGMGLGLYVVREIVTMHGGRISVESVEGQGSTFTFTLPLYTAESSAGEEPRGGDAGASLQGVMR